MMMVENLEGRRLMSVSIGTMDTTITTEPTTTVDGGSGLFGALLGQVVKAINDAAAQAARRQ